MPPKTAEQLQEQIGNLQADLIAATAATSAAGAAKVLAETTAKTEVAAKEAERLAASCQCCALKAETERLKAEQTLAASSADPTQGMLRLLLMQNNMSSPGPSSSPGPATPR